MNGLLTLGVARIIGSLVGGVASEAFGMRSMFLYNSILALVCILVFGIVFQLQRGKDAAMSRS